MDMGGGGLEALVYTIDLGISVSGGELKKEGGIDGKFRFVERLEPGKGILSLKKDLTYGMIMKSQGGVLLGGKLDTHAGQSLTHSGDELLTEALGKVGVQYSYSGIVPGRG